MPKRRLNTAEKAEAKRQKQLEKLRQKEEAKRLKKQAAAKKKCREKEAVGLKAALKSRSPSALLTDNSPQTLNIFNIRLGSSESTLPRSQFFVLVEFLWLLLNLSENHRFNISTTLLSQKSM